MTKLSENFTLEECLKSAEAQKRGIKNQLDSSEHLINLCALIHNVAQPLRNFANTAIHPSSVYRCDALNKAIGGSDTSFHRFAQAIDIDQDYKYTQFTNRHVFDYIYNNLPFTELIWEYGDQHQPSWVHVAYAIGRADEKEALICYTNQAGKRDYINYSRQTLEEIYGT